MRTDLCALCHDVMMYEPGAVPTTELDDGTRGEICQKCVNECNELRAEDDLDLLPVPPGSYGEVQVS